MSRLSRGSALLLTLLILPGVLGQASDQADHHAFMAGRDLVTSGEPLVLQINHTIFQWATIWYSARVEAGPPVRAFMVDEANLSRFQAGDPFAPLAGTESGPDALTQGSAGTLGRGIYHLVVLNDGAGDARVKWEIFFEPRLTGDPSTPGEAGGSGPSESPPLLANPLLWAAVLGVAGAGFLVFLWRRGGRRG